jgi:hypothetical protein
MALTSEDNEAAKRILSRRSVQMAPRRMRFTSHILPVPLG